MLVKVLSYITNEDGNNNKYEQMNKKKNKLTRNSKVILQY